MSGSLTGLRTLPRPIELFTRVAIVSVLVLGILNCFQRSIIEPLIPTYCSTIRLLTADFAIMSTDLLQQGSTETVRFRANLTGPIEYAGHMVYPMGWNGTVRGGYQVTLTLGGLLQYPALTLILIGAWPFGNLREFMVRVALSVPAIAGLLILVPPSIVIGNLWALVRNDVDPQESGIGTIWTNFLAGGGGLVLAAVLGVLAIAAARRLVPAGQH
jgi:hypothetical protein